VGSAISAATSLLVPPRWWQAIPPMQSPAPRRPSPGRVQHSRGKRPSPGSGHESHQGRRRSDHPNSGAPAGGDTGSVVSVHGTVSARGAFAATGLRPLLAQEPLGGGEPVVDALIDLLAEVFVEVVGQMLADLAEPGGPIDRGGALGLLAEGLERGDADEDEHD